MDTEFFKVPFTDVLDLVRRRAVYIQNGFAYVSQVSFRWLGQSGKLHLNAADGKLYSHATDG